MDGLARDAAPKLLLAADAVGVQLGFALQIEDLLRGGKWRSHARAPCRDGGLPGVSAQGGWAHPPPAGLARIIAARVPQRNKENPSVGPQRLGIKGVDVTGTSLRTGLAGDCTTDPREIIEAALAHTIASLIAKTGASSFG